MVNWSSRARIKVCRLGIGLALVALGCARSQNDPQPASVSAERINAGIALPDVTGKMVRPLVMESGQHAAVLIFVTTECPICNAYAGEINRLNQAFANRGVQFFLVDVDANLSAAEVLQHAREYALTATILLDPDQVLAKKYAATTTPEAIVIDAAGSILYRGRIDDLYTSLGQRRYEAREHDLWKLRWTPWLPVGRSRLR